MSGEDGVPVYLRSTYKLLKCAFPEGLDGRDYMSLVVVLREEGHMSFRNIAACLSAFTDKHYAVVYNDASFGSEDRPDQEEINRIKQKLTLCGYEQWLDEDR